MSKYFVAGVCFLLPLLIFAGAIDHSISLRASDVKVEMVNAYDYVRIAGYDHLSTPGHPALPVKYLSFVIPPDAEFDGLEIINERGEYLSGTYDVFPVQKPVPTIGIQHVEFTPPDETIYGTNRMYPTATLEYVHSGNLSGFRIVSVLYKPLHYNPIEKKLYLTSDITFRIRYRSGASVVRSVTASQRRVAENRVRTLVVNDHQLGVCAPPVRTGVGTWQSEYIIITDPAFVDAFERLREWKTKKGVAAEIVTTSWIYSNYSGADKAEQMRNFMKVAADSGALYFLLAGQCDWENGEEFVARRDVYCWTTGYPSWPDVDTVPSDMYFSDLDGDWDADNDGTYGEMEDNVDLYSNVFVGRAPVKSIQQVDNFVSKVITYERAPSFDYIEKAMLCVGNLFAGNHGNGMQDTIADTIPDDWQKSKLYEDYGLITRYSTRDSIDQGFHLSNLVGHGNQRGVFYSGGVYYDHSDPGTQVNDSSEAIIVTSNACHPGAVDKGYSATDYDCCAERMVNSNKACATATLMNTRFGWSGSIPEGNIQLTDEIIVWFYRHLFGSDAYHLGEVLAATKDYLAPKAVNSQIHRWCTYTFNLFGDPEMPIWTDLPDTMLISHPPIVLPGPSTFTVTVQDAHGMPMEGALVCCYISTQEPAMHSTAYTDASGTAVLDVSPEADGDTMYVTATKHNYLAKESYVLVHGSGPYVTSNTLVIDDAGHNGQVNMGESVDLGIWARNWGNDAANRVTGSLSESDPYVTLSSSDGRYGRIRANDSALSRKPYRFSVAADCPNQHVITFDLEFRDRNNNTWVSHPNLTVFAPVLMVHDVAVVSDNNSDGILGPGEKATLVVTLVNDGDATAANTIALLTTGSPYVTISDGVSAFGDIEPGSIGDNTGNPFTVILDPATPYGTEIDFSITIQAGAYSETLDFTLAVLPPLLSLLEVNVVNDDNGNGLFEPGEAADLVATFTNDGEVTAEEMTSLLRTESPYSAIYDSAGAFGSIASGDTVDNADDPYTVFADSATPNFEEIPFSIVIQAGTFTDTFDFTVTVYVPIITLQDVRVVNDDDGDGALEPGETGDLIVTLHNEGAVGAEELSSVLNSISSYITFVDSLGYFGAIDPGASVDNAADPYTVIADNATPYFSQVDFSAAVEAGLYEDTFDFALNVGQYPPSDTGYYWTFYSSGPHIQSPVFEWMAIDMMTQTQYPGTDLGLINEQTVHVALPFTFTYYGNNYTAISVSSNGWIIPGSTNSTDRSNSAIPHLDGPKRMIAGLWDDLNPDVYWQSEPQGVFYYYDETNHRFIVEYYQISHYPYRGNQYETFEIILHDPAYYPTPTGDGEIIVQFLTKMHQNIADSIWGPDCDAWDNTVGIENQTETVGVQYYYDGVYHLLADTITDSFAIKYTTHPRGAYPRYPQDMNPMSGGIMQVRDHPTESFPTRTLLSAIQPNPFARHTKIQYQLVTASTVNLRVYDAAGRLVNNLVDGMCRPGYYNVMWDGCDDIGRRVPAGVYFVSFETDSYQRVEKAVLLR